MTSPQESCTQKETDTSKYVKKKITLKDAQHILAKII